jgi:hypothetical protein
MSITAFFLKIIFPLKETLINKKIGELEKEIKRTNEILWVAEKKFLKHQITKKAFDEINFDSQAKLVTLEAELSAKKAELGVERKISEAYSFHFTGREKRIFELLSKEKKLALKEIGILKKKLLRRKVDEESFKKLVDDNEKKLIRIKVDMDALYRKKAEEIVNAAKKSLLISEKKKEKIKEKEMVEDVANELRFMK